MRQNEDLSNRYWYIEDTEGSRAVGGHSAGVIEALRNVYGANELVNELADRLHSLGCVVKEVFHLAHSLGVIVNNLKVDRLFGNLIRILVANDDLQSIFPGGDLIRDADRAVIIYSRGIDE